MRELYYKNSLRSLEIIDQQLSQALMEISSISLLYMKEQKGMIFLLNNYLVYHLRIKENIMVDIQVILIVSIGWREMLICLKDHMVLKQSQDKN